MNEDGMKDGIPTWNEEFELLDGSYSISDIQDFLNIYLISMGKNS